MQQLTVVFIFLEFDLLDCKDILINRNYIIYMSRRSHSEV